MQKINRDKIKNALKIILCAFFVPIFFYAAEKTVKVEDFGAFPGDNFDDTAAIQKALDAAVAKGTGVTVLFKAGEYRISAQNSADKYCLKVNSAKGLTLCGTGTKLLITSPEAGVFSFYGGEDCLVKGFQVDYNPLPFTQGKIIKTDPSNGSFDLKIDEGYKLLEHPMFKLEDKPRYCRWGCIFPSTGKTIKENARDNIVLKSFSKIAERSFSVYPEEKAAVSDMEPGDRFVYLGRNNQHIIFFAGSVNSGVEDVTVNASPSCSIALIGTSKMHIKGLSVRFSENSSRLITTNADGVHCQQNRIGPVIEDCYFEGMTDDAVNIYAPPNTVSEISNGKELLVSKNCRILKGDLLQVLEPKSGTVRAEVAVSEISDAGDKYRLLLEKQIEGISIGDTLYNLNACGKGFIIRNNTMKNYRGRGILLRGRNGLVEGNRITNVSGLGISVTNEPDWPEGPVPADIIIRNNEISGNGYARGNSGPFGAAIYIKANALGNKAAKAAVKNIVIENNIIRNWPVSGIFAGSVEGLKITDNTLIYDLSGWKKDIYSAYFESCKDIEVKGLKIDCKSKNFRGLYTDEPKTLLK